ncbi:DMT family transporter [Actibacterium mucosum]
MLLLAILTETIGTTALNASQQFTKAWPTALMVVAYVASFYCMSHALKTMPVGIVYAIWSGLGIVLIAFMGFLVFGQRLDLPAVAGMGLIVAGVLVMHLFSNTTSH